jgi:hypothetical protein
LPGGFCVNTTQADCSQRGGTYNGQRACGSPSQECPRACCLPSGQCQELTPSQCALAFGSIQTLGSTCQTVVCDNPCLCYWLNGEADGRNAVVSESNVLVPRSDSADDIIVPAGNVLFGREFCGIMVTNDLYRRVGWIIDKPNALLNIYSDCNGKPGDLLAMFTTPTYEVLGNAPFGSPGQWKYVKFCFDIASLRLDASEREQRFWVSLVGVGENDPGDRYFWATSKTEPTTSVQGVQAQLRSDWVVGFEDWRDIEDTNAVCHDLAFDLCGDLVGVIGDTSSLALDCGVKMLNTTSFRTKVADNFQVQPCAFAEIREVTLWVATNLAPTAATLEVYGDGCDQPELIVPQAGTLSTREVRSNGAPVVFVSPVSSQPLPVYELTWSFPPGVFGLEGGRNFWLASFLESGGESTAEAFALCRPSTSCDIVITQARFLTAPFGVNDWTAVSSVLGAERDLAYRVLGVVRPAELPSYLASPQRDPDPVAVPAKMSDLNGDGVVDVEDVREMLRRIGAAGSSDSAGR